MRVVLVITRTYLEHVDKILDQRNVEIVAVVTDDRPMAIEHGFAHDLVFGLWQLQNVLNRFDPEYVLFLVPFRSTIENLSKKMREIKFPMNRICDLSDYIHDESKYLAMEIWKLKEDPNQYEIFSTGISYSKTGIDPNSFSLPLKSFAHSSQDLYYDFQIAKRILKVAPPPRDQNGIRYALIGLAPYSLHYDLSRCVREAYFLSKYFVALDDLHNYWIDREVLVKFIRPEHLQKLRESAKTFHYEYKLPTTTMSLSAALDASNEISTWGRKSYPDTVAENKKILEDYLALLDSHEIFPILFLPPMMKEYQDGFCREKIDELFSFIYDLMKRHRFAIVDGWKMKGFIDYDFRDINHLNINGARKFSKILNDLVMKLESQR